MQTGTAAQASNLGMSTVMIHSAYGKHAEKALRAVRAEAVRLEELLSMFRAGSEISRINRSAGIKSVKVSDDTYEVLKSAVEFSELCEGIFDVTIGPLTGLWKKSRDGLIPPEDLNIRKLLPLVDYTAVKLDPVKKTVCLMNAGQSIDLGGIGKGYAGDSFLRIFKKYGISSAYTNIGGNVAALGTKPDGSPWRVGIKHPRQEDRLIGSICVADKAVVTSGDYQRYFIGNDGKRYHHILDPATGYPAQTDLASVTVVTRSSMDADALSTVLFIAGLEKGRELIRRFPGAEAVFVDQELKVCITDGLQDCFQPGEGIQISVFN